MEITFALGTAVWTLRTCGVKWTCAKILRQPWSTLLRTAAAIGPAVDCTTCTATLIRFVGSLPMMASASCRCPLLQV